MKLSCVHIFSSRIDAEIARGLLESNGIQAVVTADDKGGADPFLTFTNGVKILVNENDIIAAKKILKIDSSF